MSKSASELFKENEFLRSEIERYKGMFIRLQREKYGSKSERADELALDQMVFNEIEQEAAKLPEETESISYTRKKKGRGKKKPFPEHWPREDKIIDLPEEEKICPRDGTPLKEISEEVTEKAKVIPAQMSVVVERRKKYACPCCDAHVAQAKANSVLPGTIATPELLSFLIFSKFFQSLPLYRIQEQFKLNGFEIKRGTMARWLVDLSGKLIPVWNVLEEKMLGCGYMGIDATSVQVLKEKGRAPQTKSFMWVRGSPELGIVLFDYHPSGSGKVAKDLVSGFSGGLQADAHRGYNQINREHLLLLGCMMHSRRRFHDAWVTGDKKPGIAADGLKLLQFIYHKEEQYREKGLTPEERKRWRDMEVKPSLEEMKKWCGWQIKKVPPSSLIANALNYFVNEYDELTAFLQNGRYEIDNGWVERQIKRFGVGRRAWLFCDTVEGAQSSSVLYSLALTAKLNLKDPFQVMTKVLSELPTATTIDDYERLAEMFLSEANPRSCRKKEGALIH